MSPKTKLIGTLVIIAFGVTTAVITNRSDQIATNVARTAAQEEYILEHGAELDIREYGYNVSLQDGEQGSIVYAKPGDEVLITLQISSAIPMVGLSSTARAILLPSSSGVNGTGASYLANTTMLNGALTGRSGIVGEGIIIDTYSSNPHRISFKIKISDENDFPSGTSVLDVYMIFESQYVDLIPRVVQDLKILVTNN